MSGYLKVIQNESTFDIFTADVKSSHLSRGRSLFRGTRGVVDRQDPQLVVVLSLPVQPRPAIRPGFYLVSISFED